MKVTYHLGYNFSFACSIATSIMLLLICMLAHVTIAIHMQRQQKPLYQMVGAPIPVRVADLLKRMTLAEKAAQLGYGGGRSVCGMKDALKYPNGIGGVYASGINCSNAGQMALRNVTRLGIPVSYFGETTHSGGAAGTTVFPMPVSQGASWNATLVEEIARINALELRASGGDQALSPILQVCTDARFGRMEENFGEDPFLVSAMGRAAVRGLQGSDGLGGSSTYLGSPSTRVAAQAKHYAAYGAGSKDGYTPMGGGPSVRTLFEVYLRPWRDFAQLGGRGVMASHNMANHVPMHANKALLTDTLRWRFGLGNGYIGSDNINVEALAYFYRGFARDAADAAVMAMTAGVDQDMPGSSFLAADVLVKNGNLSADVLDRAVGNVLTKKYASGLFDAPPYDPKLQSLVGAHAPQARMAAREGCVLLKNDAVASSKGTVASTTGTKQQPLLPLDASAVKTVAVIGPLGDGQDAQQAMLGGYSSGPGPKGRVPVTVAAGLRARGLRVVVVQGSDAGRGGPAAPSAAQNATAAAAAAIAADVTVLVLGAVSCGCCDRCGNGEVGDRNSLDFEGRQAELAATVASALAATGKAPPVTVLIHGRPVSFGPDNALLSQLPALLTAWRPGQEGGNAIADLLFGDYDFSGRLAQAWPRSAGYIGGPTSPWFQTHSSMTSGHYFPNGDGAPSSALFAFTHGLSYTSFNFTVPQVSPASLGPTSPDMVNGTGLVNASTTVSVTVINTGSTAGSTPVFVSFSKQTRGVVRYLREVAAFDKVYLKAGESRVVHIPVRVVDLARYDEWQPWTDLKTRHVTGAYMVDGGHYDIYVGGCVSVGQAWDDSASCKSSVSPTTGLDIQGNWVYL